MHNAEKAIVALPLEDLDAGDALKAARRLTAPSPAGSMRAVLVHEGHILIFTAPAAPGCLALK